MFLLVMERISFLDNIWLIFILVIWTLFWKGLALWRSARSNSLKWFLVILILNTLGLLEIIYIFAISRKKQPENPPSAPLDTATRKKLV